MKAILMSIRPKWVEKIASGEKTVEVRKTVPKCGTPFKVYMYETKAQYVSYQKGALTKYGYGKGQVVGEFVCDCITDFWADNTGFEAEGRDPFYMPCGYAKKATCLTNEQFVEYGKGATLYGLHISDLKIYDKPKELSEFKKVKKVRGYHKDGESPVEMLMHADRIEVATITRPPQSWQFVEEL